MILAICTHVKPFPDKVGVAGTSAFNILEVTVARIKLFEAGEIEAVS